MNSANRIRRAGIGPVLLLGWGWIAAIGPSRALGAELAGKCETAASSTAAGTATAGAIDGDRFSAAPARLWKGAAGQKSWWWQVRFAQPRPVGAILQIVGDNPLRLSCAPRRYVWQASDDGKTWLDLPETATQEERRMFRLHRLAHARRTQYLRMLVCESLGDAPVLREIEVYGDPSATVPFPDWIIAVSTLTQDSSLPGGTGAYVDLARQCRGWEEVLAQQVWLGDFDESFVAAEPRPLCAFLTGNTLDWCQQSREPWRGVQEVFTRGNLPIWASCGGAQGLLILQETGVGKPWDCPRCRDPQRPKSPVYSHIGHTGPAPCGDYSKNVWERGKHQMRLAARDPAFQGLPFVFEAMESHVGQIAYVPENWVRVVTNGPWAVTENQCLRLKDRYVYAAQFHIDMVGTPETSRKIMGNFLALAKQWGAYNPRARPVPVPEPVAPQAAK